MSSEIEHTATSVPPIMACISVVSVERSACDGWYGRTEIAHASGPVWFPIRKTNLLSRLRGIAAT